MQVRRVIAMTLALHGCDSSAGTKQDPATPPSSRADKAPVKPPNVDAKCTTEDANKCISEARALLFGDGRVTKDPARARDLAISACERGAAGGCTLAGLAYSSAFADAVTARRWLERGCDERDGVGCAALAYQYFEGGLAGDATGVERDPKRGADLASKACELGAAKGCALLAKALASGEGIPADIGRARDLAATACTADEVAGCAIAAKIAQHDGRTDDEQRFRQRACALGYRPDCK